MAEIKIDENKMKALVTELREIEEQVNRFVDNGKGTGYVNDNLFEISSGQSVNMFNTMLENIVVCTKDLSNIIAYTKQYFDTIIVGFKEEDNRQASVISNME